MPSVKFPVDGKGNTIGKMTESAVVKFGVVYACCYNAFSGVDDAAVFLGWCEVDVKTVDHGGSVVAQASVRDLYLGSA